MGKLVSVRDLTPHPKLGGTDLLPALSAEEYDSLVASIRQDGIQQPLLVAWPEKVILDGHHRWRAAQDAGLTEVPVITEEFRSEDARLFLGLTLNVARRQLSQEQKRAAAAALIKSDPKQSDRAVAEAVGVSHPTVATVRSEMERAGEVERFTTRTGRDGVEQPASKPKRHGNGTATGPRSIIPIATKKDGTIDKLATQRAQREARAESVDVKAEIRDAKREVRESPWGRLSAYLTNRIDIPPKLTREEIREAVTGDTDGGWYVTARVVRDFLTTVLEELEAAKQKEAKGAAS